MSVESSSEQEPEHTAPRRWRSPRRWLGALGTQREDSVTTTDFEAIDPLGGVLHPSWERRKAEEEAQASQFILRRGLRRLLAGWRSDEPNLTTGDTRLDVDEGEMENLPPLTPRQERDRAVVAAAFKDAQPIHSSFYDKLFSPKDSSDR